MSARRRRRDRVADHPDETGPKLYLESSAVVAAILESDDIAMTLIRQSSTAAASALTFAESRRVFVRALASGRLSDTRAMEVEEELQRIETGCTLLEISDDILARVGRRFPVEPVRTLDAIHLASAEILDDPTAPVTVLTRDRRIRENAELLGMRVA